MRKGVRKGLTLVMITLFAMPLFVSADVIQPTPAQLLTRVAALEAQEAALQVGASPVSCAALFSVPSVPIGQTALLAWGSVGAMAQNASSTQSMWPQAGASTLSFQKAGSWTYSFIFYGVQGGTATCTATIKVTT